MGLTKREMEVLSLRKQGFTQAEIAQKLNISQPAVSSFENNARRKIRKAMKVLQFVKENQIELEDE